MNLTLNRIQLIGTTRSEPCMVSAAGGRVATSVILETRGVGEEADEVRLIRHRIIATDGLATLLRTFPRGTSLFVEGMIIQHRTRCNGVDEQVAEVRARTIAALHGRQANCSMNWARISGAVCESPVVLAEDDLPIARVVVETLRPGSDYPDRHDVRLGAALYARMGAALQPGMLLTAAGPLAHGYPRPDGGRRSYLEALKVSVAP